MFGVPKASLKPEVVFSFYKIVLSDKASFKETSESEVFKTVQFRTKIQSLSNFCRVNFKLNKN